VTARAGGGGRGDGGNRAARRDDDPLPPASASSPFPSLSHGLPHGDGGSGATAEQRAAAGGPIDGWHGWLLVAVSGGGGPGKPVFGGGDGDRRRWRYPYPCFAGLRATPRVSLNITS
jgi:hypothetical protein